MYYIFGQGIIESSEVHEVFFVSIGLKYAQGMNYTWLKSIDF